MLNGHVQGIHLMIQTVIIDEKNKINIELITSSDSLEWYMFMWHIFRYFSLEHLNQTDNSHILSEWRESEIFTRLF